MAWWLACPPPVRWVMGSRLAWAIPKTIIEMVQTASLLDKQAYRYEFDSAARLSYRIGSVLN